MSYIQRLLAALLDAEEGERAARKEQILRQLDNSISLKSKRELIERFIDEQLDALPDGEALAPAFDAYWAAEKEKALVRLIEQEKLKAPAVRQVIDTYLFTGREPLSDAIVGTFADRPSILQRRSLAERVKGKLLDWVELFLD